jgi:hypothetical protein
VILRKHEELVIERRREMLEKRKQQIEQKEQELRVRETRVFEVEPFLAVDIIQLIFTIALGIIQL